MNPARQAVVSVLARQLRSGRPIPPAVVDGSRLDARDRRLAVAVHRCVLQRLLTLEHLLDARLSKPLRTLEPVMQAVLLSGAAQLIFMRRVPVHAVVDEQVAIAKSRLRKGAGSLANAVLRRVAALLAAHEPDTPWQPAPDRLPDGDGSIRLAEPVLPPLDDFAAHLAVATSHPVELVAAWLGRFGDETVRALLLHDLQTPPVIVHAPGVDPASVGAEAHEVAPYIVWRSDHAALEAFLAGAGDRWVQDPASGAPVLSTASLDPAPRRIVDACAGRGTKTRQLAMLHPEAHVVATDVDADRLSDLRAAFAGHLRVRVVEPRELADEAGRCDLLVLDVPCSNTGVLARRPEARYRFGPRSMESLSHLQRQIFSDAAPLLAPRAAVLYATCSIEPAENDDQARWIAEQIGGRVAARRLILPAGSETHYHDGSFHALIERS